MIFACTEAESDPKIRTQIEEVLKGTSLRTKVHWATLHQQFVDSGVCTNEVLVATMNSLLMPHGIVSGRNNEFWNGLQFDPATGH